MKTIALLPLAAVIGSCAMGPSDQTVMRSAKEQAHLETLLAGKVAGAPLSCLPTYRSNDMVVVDESTIAFRSGPGQVYINHMQGGGCLNIQHGNNALVTRTIGTSLCRGDIAQVVDFSAHIPVGSCVFGDFVPFRRPRA